MRESIDVIENFFVEDMDAFTLQNLANQIDNHPDIITITLNGSFLEIRLRETSLVYAGDSFHHYKVSISSPEGISGVIESIREINNMRNVL